MRGREAGVREEAVDRGREAMRTQATNATDADARGVGGGRGGTEANGRLREAVWLAGKEIRRSWRSYPATGLAMLLMGLLVAPSMDGVLSVEGVGEGGRAFRDWYNAFFPDFLYLVLGTLLACNWMAGEYFRVFERDVFSERLVFMRSLPVSPGTLVGSRMISLCFALPFTVSAFFLPVFLISDLSDLGWGFLWFVLVWVGYSLLGAGLWLLAEFGVRGKTYVWVFLAGTGLTLAAVVFLEWAVELRAVDRIAGLAQSDGPLAAFVALIVGAAGFALMARAATRRVERRDLSA